MICRRLISLMALLMTAGGMLMAQTLSSEMEFMPGRAESGIVEAGASAEGGKLHLAQEAEQKTDLHFNAAGESQVGRFRMKGSFLFRQSFENGVKFASTFRPSRTMPYVIADSTGGNWRKQDYLMGVDISMPILQDRLSAGLAMGLEVGRGAKKVDPRPQAGLCDINLQPSLSFNSGDAGVFSAALSYNLFRESSNLILYDSSQPQKLYLLKGLGQYVYEVFSTNQRERKYEGRKLGTALSWMKVSGKYSFNARGAYRNGMEAVFDIDNNKPHDRGQYYTHEYEAAASVLHDGNSWGWEAALSLTGEIGSGREIIQHFDSSSDVNAWVTDSENPARYVRRDGLQSIDFNAWLKDERGNRTWKFDASVDRRNTVQEYKATSSFMRQDVLLFTPAISRDIYCKSGILSISLGGNISHLLASGLDYAAREDTDPTIAEGLIYHDFNLPLDRYGVHASAGYGMLLKNGRKLAFEGRGSFISGGGLGRWSAGLALRYSF